MLLTALPKLRRLFIGGSERFWQCSFQASATIGVLSGADSLELDAPLLMAGYGQWRSTSQRMPKTSQASTSVWSVPASAAPPRSTTCAWKPAARAAARLPA
eukprot:scaffold82623_cov66-Phaeocystis_antarctica.AAC.3